MKKIILLLFCINLFFSVANAQENGLWAKISEKDINPSEKLEKMSSPRSFQVYSLNLDLLKAQLATAPDREKTSQSNLVVAFPGANGEMQHYKVFEASVMDPALAARYADIKSYIGLGIEDPAATIRFSTTVFGLHTITFSGNGDTGYIEPYTKDLRKYLVYDKSTLVSSNLFHCENDDKADMGTAHFASREANEAFSTGGTYRTYRLAISSTIEYSNYHIAAAGVTAGTDAQKRAAVLAAMVVTMTRVNGLYERDLAIHLILIANNDILISIGSDTFSNNSGGALLGQNQAYVDANIGSGAYDIGHIFSTGGGGIASLGSVCNSSQKARGVTGSPAPVGDPFNIDYVAHEMGHQFGATHTFNGDQGSCEGNRTDETAVEPGSGSTIMAYAGICAPQDIQAHSDAHFNVMSLAQIDSFVGSFGTCSVNTANNNAAPVVGPLQSYTIPLSTPFVLKGTATDANNPGTLTYCWEQIDNEVSTQPPTALNDDGPNFRSRPPSASTERYFPIISSVYANNLTPTWEVIPSIARTLNFALTVRDNASPNGGQTGSANMVVTVASVGPFLVSAPNTNVSWPVGSNQTVTWDVAGTTANGVNTPYVDIYMATTAGVFTTLLASKVPNDGSETITIPNNPGGSNRIMVKGYNNIFYDISNVNFTIASAPAATLSAGFNGIAGQQNKSTCQGNNAVYPIAYTPVAGFSGTTTFSATGNPAGSTVSFSPASIAAAGTVNMTVGNTAAVTPGFYTIAVTATSGSIVKTMNFYLDLASSSFPAITLSSPANLATAQPTTLTLAWNNAGVANYQVQVATDAGFANLVYNTTVATNSYQVSGLNNTTDYYWRVAPVSGECSGAFSAAFKFKTSFCDVYASTNVPIIISESGTSTVNSILTIPAASNIAVNDVNVTVNITHTWVRDLTIRLISPQGTQITLLTGICSQTEAGHQNVIATFDDSGTVQVCGTIPAISGKVIPFQALTALNGQNSQGIWTLRVSDAADGDGGVINSWSLNLCSAQAPLGINEESKFDFAVSPNPNNGSFNIQSDKIGSDDVKVMVYDIRGRLIFEKEYSVTDRLDENIQLRNAEAGVYLLSVADGQNKEVKRIIVK